MNSDLLVVASPTTQPLCTVQPVPTDGQPQWYLCGSVHGVARFPVPPGVVRDCDTPGGPFPFTVARWTELDTCGACRTPLPPYWWKSPPACDYHVSGRCDPWSVYDSVGAIVELVEVVGPSHHADDYGDGRPCADSLGRTCQPDAAPDCWHTPTGTITPIGPIPCERSGKRIDVDSRSYEPAPSVWVADASVREHLRGMALR